MPIGKQKSLQEFPTAIRATRVGRAVRAGRRVNDSKTRRTRPASNSRDASRASTNPPAVAHAESLGKAISYQWNPIKQLKFNVWGIHRGETEDEIFEMFQEKRMELKPYTVVNAGINWQATDDLALNFRAENIFNEDYYEVYGYGTMPQSFYAGVSYNLSSGKGL